MKFLDYALGFFPWRIVVTGKGDGFGRTKVGAGHTGHHAIIGSGHYGFPVFVIKPVYGSAAAGGTCPTTDTYFFINRRVLIYRGAVEAVEFGEFWVLFRFVHGNHYAPCSISY